MTKKKESLTDIVVEEVKVIEEPIETLVLRPRVKLNAEEFKVLEEHVRLLNKNVNVILIPYSCEVVEDAE